MNQNPIGLWGGSNLYLFAPNIHNWIDPLGWEKDWVKYEEKIRKLYPTRSKRKYKGSDCEGVEDGIANVNGKETAIEAKYINKWKNSAYNPESFFSKCIKKDGTEEERLIDQAKDIQNALTKLYIIQIVRDLLIITKSFCKRRFNKYYFYNYESIGIVK